MIAQFTLRLLCGIAGMWCVMPRSQVTCGFFRIQMMVAMALAVVAAMSLGTQAPTETADVLLGRNLLIGLTITTAVVSYVGSVVWTLARRTSGAVIACLIFVLSSSAVIGLLPQSTFSTFRGGVSGAGSEISAAWLSGSAMTAMLLGHWYLTAPMMKLNPLTVLNYFLMAASTLRGVVAGAGLAALGTSQMTSTHLTWLGMRWVAGIVLPLVISLLVPRVLKYRNTQSATGLLFAAVILVFIGETAAAVLSRDLQWPL